MSTATTDRRPPEPPRQLNTPDELRRWSERCRAAGLLVGLVPTMGALHAGHRSLLQRARADCDRVVVSIFVNPLQFGAGEDIDRYPRTLNQDIAVLTEERVDAVFVPAVDAMYGPEMATAVRVDPSLTDVFEGEHRPGHFDGVALVVAKLLIACRPHRAYFGQKDAQQCAVVRRLARDLDTGVEIAVCPVVRDHDGLALSSRNLYLDADDRRRALAIPTGLSAAVTAFAEGEHGTARLCDLVRRPMEAAGLAVDYVAAVDADSFSPLDVAGPGCQILVAGRIGSTRLIDVIRLGIDEAPLDAAGSQGSQVPGVNGVHGRE
ncbi:MAG: pantoate--beta-alanine ligase [Candidatus Dormibacteraeota bacterium]|uniref:Pantothenate synthetase n=1 Tax=Candidatus Aeolococcus gillhamiae TaxID=3127015 RepID=A0A2W6AKQ5_9BACT|nr:pantoate--beta-alanine ligase [Candidatus Dormibacteraeota bacterium]PZR78301.1 MAG: pantoate--beta-alanine ligase [Candidatus Dormibacter sp. RRmetagenome_bin12]